MGKLRAVSIISSRNCCIVRHTCHRHVYILWLDLIYTVFRRLIYFCLSMRTSFSIFHVPVNFLTHSVQLWTICDEIILQSTSKARIWFPTVTFIALIIWVAWIKGWFLIYFFLSLLLKSFLSWVLISTVTAPWLRKNCSLVISYWFSKSK